MLTVFITEREVITGDDYDNENGGDKYKHKYIDDGPGVNACEDMWVTG